MKDNPQIPDCMRCGRRFRLDDADAANWNAVLQSGRITGALCPGCQTAEENTEAVVNEATLEYAKDDAGRFRARPRDA